MTNVKRTKWKPSEIKQLKRLVADKTEDAQIATELSRTVSSIQQKRWDKGLVKFPKRPKKLMGGGKIEKPLDLKALTTTQKVLKALGYEIIITKSTD